MQLTTSNLSGYPRVGRLNAAPQWPLGAPAERFDPPIAEVAGLHADRPIRPRLASAAGWGAV